MSKKYSAIGMDLGDEFSHLCGLDESGTVILVDKVRTTPQRVTKKFSAIPPTVVAVEASSISAWVSRVVQGCGHTVIVANPRKVQLIGSNTKKSDRADAELLARLARSDPDLLKPIKHRSKEAQADLMVIRSRDLLVRTRTKMINHVRSVLKQFGIRTPGCSAPSFHKKVEELVPRQLAPALIPIVSEIQACTEKIRRYDKYVEKVSAKKYPESSRLSQVVSVGALTAVAYILTLEDPSRFSKSRQAGTYLGLCPSSDRSSTSNPQLPISKEGNGYLRRLLIGSAHYILGAFGPPCYLREWGLKLMQRGGRNARKRAAVAVARRLAVLLHRLWVSGEQYDPFRNSTERQHQETAKAG